MKISSLILALALLPGAVAGAQNATGTPPAETEKDKQAQTADSNDQTFSPIVAGHMLTDLREAIAGGSASETLACFDRGMPDYSTFATGLRGLFEHYESFRPNYRIVETVDEQGIAIVDFSLEAKPLGSDQPAVTRIQRLRFTFGRVDDGKNNKKKDRQWKIVDLQPRSFFAGF